MVSEVIFPRFWGVVCIEKCFRNFLCKILSLPDFAVRDSDDTQTVILENIIRPCGTFYFWGLLKDCCDILHVSELSIPCSKEMKLSIAVLHLIL